MTMQDAILKKLGLSAEGDKLNKFWRIKLFSEYQGLSPREILKILNRYSAEEIVWIPVRKYGLEFEGGIPCGKDEFGEILRSKGIPFRICGYNHDIETCWKIGSDSSVNVPDLTPVEITSPQLIGIGNSGLGFKEVEKLLQIWNEVLQGRNGVNKSCGGHIHIDVYDYKWADLFRLALLVYLSWDFLKFLVPPSRRDNRYCRQLNQEYFKLLLSDSYPDRYHVLNVTNFPSKHIEFRLWPGSLNVNKVKMHLLISLLMTEVIKTKGIKSFYAELTFDRWLDLIGLKGPIMNEVRQFTVERFNHFCSREGISPEEVVVNFKQKAVELFRKLLPFYFKRIRIVIRENTAEKVAKSIRKVGEEIYFRYYGKEWRGRKEDIVYVSVVRGSSAVDAEVLTKARKIAEAVFDLLDLFQLEEILETEEQLAEEQNAEEQSAEEHTEEQNDDLEAETESE